MAMVDDPHDNEAKPQRSDQTELDALAERIRDAKIAAGLETPVKKEEPAASPLRWSRIGTDFLATVLVTMGLGWLIDVQFDTKPWGMLLMLFSGFGVGIMNIWRVLNGMKPTLEWRAPMKRERRK